MIWLPLIQIVNRTTTEKTKQTFQSVSWLLHMKLINRMNCPNGTEKTKKKKKKVESKWLFLSVRCAVYWLFIFQVTNIYSAECWYLRGERKETPKTRSDDIPSNRWYGVCQPTKLIDSRPGQSPTATYTRQTPQATQMNIHWPQRENSLSQRKISVNLSRREKTHRKPTEGQVNL